MLTEAADKLQAEQPKAVTEAGSILLHVADVQTSHRAHQQKLCGAREVINRPTAEKAAVSEQLAAAQGSKRSLRHAEAAGDPGAVPAAAAALESSDRSAINLQSQHLYQ